MTFWIENIERNIDREEEEQKEKRKQKLEQPQLHRQKIALRQLERIKK